MRRYDVESPEKGYNGTVAGVKFYRGKAVCSDEDRAAMAYFARRGYTVTEIKNEPKPKQAEGDGQFDPSKHNAPDVNAYLAGADPDERKRVLAAEGEGKARAGVLAGPHSDVSGESAPEDDDSNDENDDEKQESSA